MFYLSTFCLIKSWVVPYAFNIFSNWFTILNVIEASVYLIQFIGFDALEELDYIYKFVDSFNCLNHFWII